jgi:hypothetical protein
VTSRVAESLESAGAASIVPQSPLDDLLQIAKRLAAVWHFVAQIRRCLGRYRKRRPNTTAADALRILVHPIREAIE